MSNQRHFGWWLLLLCTNRVPVPDAELLVVLRVVLDRLCVCHVPLQFVPYSAHIVPLLLDVVVADAVAVVPLDELLHIGLVQYGLDISSHLIVLHAAHTSPLALAAAAVPSAWLLYIVRQVVLQVVLVVPYILFRRWMAVLY
jgi:hypothetical protein